MHKRHRGLDAVEDVAADYIEQQVGRHDWKNNWRVLKQKYNMVERIAEWLESYQYAQTAEAVVKHLDDMAKGVAGSWR